MQSLVSRRTSCQASETTSEGIRAVIGSYVDPCTRRSRDERSQQLATIVNKLGAASAKV